MPPPPQTTAPLRLSLLLKPLLLALAAMGLAVAVKSSTLRLSAHPEWSELASRCAATLAWLFAMSLLLRLVELVIWERVIPLRSGVRVPRLLRQFVGVLLWLAGMTVMLSQVWGIPASAVLATSGALGIVLGLALREILADFFSGIALNLERPFCLDDFIRVHQRGIRDPVIGFAREITFRSTRIITPEENLVILPNSAVAAATIENLDSPSPVGELELEIVLDWDVNLVRSDLVLGAAMIETWAIGATHGSKPPKCRIRRIDGAGVAYKIAYNIDPHKMSKGPARHALLSSVHKHMQFAGLRPMPSLAALAGMPPPVQRLVDYDQADDRRQLLDQIEIFKVLTTEERSSLAGSVTVRHIANRSRVVRIGDEGSSMFTIAAGVLEVLVSPADSDKPVRVAVLGPGDFFGEMSLLTGEGRTATVAALCPCVLYEVTHDSIKDILSNRPELVEAISSVVAERKVRSESATSGQTISVKQQTISLSASIKQGILRLFGRG